MSGGGVAPTTSSTEKSPSAGSTAINAALFSQLGAAPKQQAKTQSQQPQQQYYQPQQQYAQPQVQQSMQAAYNPFRSQASQTLNIPGFQGTANPFYSPSRAPTPQTQNPLMAQYAAHQQQQAASIQAGRAAQLEQATRLQKAYADAQAAEKARAAAAKAKAEAELLAQQQSGYSGGGWYSGNAGGDVGIAGLRRRK